MDVKDVLKGLYSIGDQGRALNYPLLIRAMDHGLVDQDTLNRIKVILSEEIADTSVQSVDDHPAANADAAQKDEIILTENDRMPLRTLGEGYNRTQSALKHLVERYPATADAYYAWYRDLLAQPLLTLRGNEREHAAQKLHHFADTAESELVWQKIFEQNFWNSLYLGVLQNIDPESSALLSEAHNRFDHMGVRNDGQSAPTVQKRDALAMQLPLLGAEIMMALNGINAMPTILELGPEAEVALPAWNETLRFDLPAFKWVDIARNAIDSRQYDEHVVSLPINVNFIGQNKWNRIVKTPFFIEHQYRLLPSNLFWRTNFSEERPRQQDDLALMIMPQINPRFQMLPHERAKKNLKKERITKSSVFAVDATVDTKEPWIYHFRLEDRNGRANYRFIAEYGRLINHAISRNVELQLDIDKGQVTHARFILYIDRPLIVEMNAKRISHLVARARKGFIPGSGAGVSSDSKAGQDGSAPITGFQTVSETHIVADPQYYVQPVDGSAYMIGQCPPLGIMDQLGMGGMINGVLMTSVRPLTLTR